MEENPQLLTQEQKTSNSLVKSILPLGIVLPLAIGVYVAFSYFKPSYPPKELKTSTTIDNPFSQPAKESQNPFSTASAYQNPFAVTSSPGSEQYKNPFAQ